MGGPSMSDLCSFDPNRSTTAPLQSEGWITFRWSPEEVFTRIADHAALGDWVPLVHEVTVSHPRPVAPGESVIGTTRVITLKGGLAIVERVVHWDPPRCYAYTAEGRLFPFRNYVGLFSVEPTDAHGGRFIFREYFDEMGRVGRAIMPHGVIALGKQALGNLSRLIGGTEYVMTTVSRA
jgi:hypothetical protein